MVDQILRDYFVNSSLPYNEDRRMFEYHMDPVLSTEDLEIIVKSDNPKQSMRKIVNTHAAFEYEAKVDGIVFALEQKYPEEIRKESDFYEKLNSIMFGSVGRDYLDQEMNINISVDSGNKEGGYKADITSTWERTIPEESSLLWLARQQGYKKTEMVKTFTDGGVEDECLASICREATDYSHEKGTITFFVKMPLSDYIIVRHAMLSEAEYNASPLLKERSGRGYVVIQNSVRCGLTDCHKCRPGDCAIVLRKEVRLPLRCIASMTYDSVMVHPFFKQMGDLWEKSGIELHVRKPAGGAL